METSVDLLKIEDDGAGGSRFATITVNQHQANVGGVPVLVTDPFQAQSVVFLDGPANSPQSSPHPAPSRQLVVVLDGEAEVLDSHGRTERFGSGDVLLAEDTHGRHINRLIQGPLQAIVIDLPAGQPDPS